MCGRIAQLVERSSDKAEVPGSIPGAPTVFGWGCSSTGRAPALQAGGCRFEPGHLHWREVGWIGLPDPLTALDGASKIRTPRLRELVIAAESAGSRRRSGVPGRGGTGRARWAQGIFGNLV